MISPSEDQSSPISPLRLLLVEDSPGDASLIQSTLSDPVSLFEVHWVESVETAIEALAAFDFECLLVDLSLPDGDGLAVIDALTSRMRSGALVVLTGRDDSTLPLLAIQRGADDYFLKSELSQQGLHRSITYAIERTRAKGQLEQMSTRSSAVMSALGDGLIVFDRDGVIVTANPAAESLVGVAPGESVGMSLSQFPCTYVRTDCSPVAPGELAIERTLLSGDSLRGEIRGVCRPNGTLSWVEVNTHPLWASDGGIDGAVMSVHDITKRLETEEATRFQAALLAAVGQAVTATDRNGIIVYWNKAAEDTYGMSAAEALNRSLAYLVPLEVKDLATQIMDLAVAGQSWTGDFQAQRRDGSFFPALVTTTPMLDETGEMKAMIAVSVDITERKKAEEAAQALSAIVESTPDAVLTAGLDGTILTWNRGAEELYGYTEDRAVGSHIRMLDPDLNDDVFRASMQLVAHGGTQRDAEIVRRRRDGTLVPVSVTVSPMVDQNGAVVGLASIGRDVSDRKRLELELSHQALHDSLTGLPNRTLLADRLSQALAGASRRSAPVSVLFLDLDQFKNINDANGHLMGDDLLIEVAARLKMALRPSDTLARFGGDEFVIVCDDTGVEEAQSIAERLKVALADPIDVGGSIQYISASIGIAVSPPLEADPNALLRYADTAMYEAKARGRSRCRVFDAAMATESKDKLALTNDLRDALRENVLEVHYQPVVELASGRLVGLEALTRWHHPARGWIPPTIFVPLAEENGLIAALDQWVLTRACWEGAELRATGLLSRDALLSVNISARNVCDLELIDWVRTAAASADFPLEALELEVTETAIMAEVPTIRMVLEGLRTLGVGISLDDFGTGYSSLTFVRQLPVTTIKIDRSFTQHITDRRDDQAIAASVIDLARAVGLRTVAEGVETPEQLAKLHSLGCQAGQGYLWSSALPARDLVARLRCEPQGFASAPRDSTLRAGRLAAGRSPRKTWRKSHIIPDETPTV
jgi:diguanylate cyclase (GGDEF)-like protein/PAS domain S-box-containing protein